MFPKLFSENIHFIVYVDTNTHKHTLTIEVNFDYDGNTVCYLRLYHPFPLQENVTQQSRSVLRSTSCFH